MDHIQYKDIDDLTKQDKKTIEQKVMKCLEELGELSQKILIYEKCHGTSYKPMTAKDDILEEISDVLIVTMSINAHYNFTYEELHAMIYKKMNKWQKVLDE